MLNLTSINWRKGGYEDTHISRTRVDRFRHERERRSGLWYRLGRSDLNKLLLGILPLKFSVTRLLRGPLKQFYALDWTFESPLHLRRPGVWCEPHLFGIRSDDLKILPSMTLSVQNKRRDRRSRSYHGLCLHTSPSRSSELYTTYLFTHLLITYNLGKCTNMTGKIGLFTTYRFHCSTFRSEGRRDPKTCGKLSRSE